MAIVSSIARGFSSLRADAGPASQGDAGFDDRYYNTFQLAAWGAGMRITPDTVKRIAAAQACTRIIARNIAMMPKKVYTTTDRGKRLATDCPEYQLLYSRPNDRQTSYEFFEMQQGHFELSGNAYAEKKMDRRGVTQMLLPMHPARVTPEILTNGRMRYKYNDPLTNGTRVLVQEEVFHLRNWSDDGYVGQSTVSMCADIFGVALAAQDYTARFFQNDAKPGLYFQPEAGGPKFKDQAAKEEFRENWRKAQTGKNRHKVAIIPPGLVLKEFGIKPIDAQLLDARKFSRIEICSLFGVPPHLLGETEKAATYASVEQFNIMFATQCLLPRVVAWEQALQRDILQDEAFVAKFSMAAILRGDNASRTAAYAVAIQNGWMSQNDVRLLEDLDPIEDGDTYWRPLAWAPLGTLTNAQPAGNNAKPTPEPEQQDIENDETKKAMAQLADIRHNVHVLAAMAGKSGADADALLQTMR
jgi:HK97 family phage portal protein